MFVLLTVRRMVNQPFNGCLLRISTLTPHFPALIAESVAHNMPHTLGANNCSAITFD
jgi:hypothetical protein